MASTPVIFKSLVGEVAGGIVVLAARGGRRLIERTMGAIAPAGNSERTDSIRMETRGQGDRTTGRLPRTPTGHGGDAIVLPSEIGMLGRRIRRKKRLRSAAPADVRSRGVSIPARRDPNRDESPRCPGSWR